MCLFTVAGSGCCSLFKKKKKTPQGAWGSWNGIQSFTSVQSLSHVQLFSTPWTAAHQASLSITNSWNLFKLMSIESVMPSSHLILCRPLLLLPSIFPSIRVSSNESVVCIRGPEYWSFSFSTCPSTVSVLVLILQCSCVRYHPCGS